MKILGIDTTAKTCTAAITEGGRILGETAVTVALTHSQTLMPIIDGLLKASGIPLGEIGVLAVSRGPGSFTGVRIGIGTVKGLSQGLSIPCAGVSTLEALAFNLRGFDGLILPAMDARCGQFYTALFQGVEGEIVRLREDDALPADEILNFLPADTPVWAVGDGAALVTAALHQKRPLLRTAPPQLLFQKASSVCFAAEKLLETAPPLSAGELVPDYLRLSQAERELLKKNTAGQKAI